MHTNALWGPLFVFRPTRLSLSRVHRSWPKLFIERSVATTCSFSSSSQSFPSWVCGPQQLDGASRQGLGLLNWSPGEQDLGLCCYITVQLTRALPWPCFSSGFGDLLGNGEASKPPFRQTEGGLLARVARGTRRHQSVASRGLFPSRRETGSCKLRKMEGCYVHVQNSPNEKHESGEPTGITKANETGERKHT